MMTDQGVERRPFELWWASVRSASTLDDYDLQGIARAAWDASEDRFDYEHLAFLEQRAEEFREVTKAAIRVFEEADVEGDFTTTGTGPMLALQKVLCASVARGPWIQFDLDPAEETQVALEAGILDFSVSGVPSDPGEEREFAP